MKKIISILSISLVFSTSCDFLEEDNKSGISNDDLYSTAVGYETLMTAAYASLKTVYGETPWLILGGTDIYQKGRNTDHQGMYDYQLYPSDPDVTSFYKKCYSAIQTVNMALFYNEAPVDINDGRRAMYAAELRFLRAFYHFLLLEQFGSIVISKDATRTPITSMSRQPLDECYKFIIAEIEGILPQLGAEKGRVTKDAANHFLAKIYLTRGWDFNSPADFAKAKEYAQTVISSRGAITLTYADLWRHDNEDNSEVIFTVQYDLKSIASRTEGNSQQSLYCSHLGGQETFQKQGATQLIPAWNLLMWFEENDTRYFSIFMTTVYETYFDYYTVDDKSTLKVRAWYPRVWGRSERREYSADSVAFVNSHTLTDNPIKNYYPFLENEESYRANINQDFNTCPVMKFDSPVSGDVRADRASVRDIVLARLAETYFLYAEACIGQNDYTTAAQYVQKVLDRPGNTTSGTLTNAVQEAINGGTPTQQEVLHGYLKESAKEFLGEYNGRWNELRRTRMLKYMLERYNYDVKKLGINNFDFDHKYNLRPIPEEAINLNDGITLDDQNPGYK
ncbi:MAG: RagB/SusD family nutrient uptake outer membrane protein [Bacteroidales bacterium]|jgi:hypothetical protein|nr:RagB/SusD family nutrient uptake outer membrane protein [Bacteroidales bacterium]